MSVLPAFSSLSASHAWDSVQLLDAVKKAGNQISNTEYISQDFLLEVAQENNLLQKISEVIHQTDWQDAVSRYKTKRAIRHLIANQVIPEHLATQLFYIYHSKCTKRFVNVVAEKREEQVTHNNIVGEANFIQSLVSAWADAIAQHIIKTRSAHLESIIPDLLIIQDHDHAQSSGFAFTKPLDSGYKARIIIFAVSGEIAHHDVVDCGYYYEVDIRTWNIVKKTVGTQTVLYKREADSFSTKKITPQEPLTISQIINLAKQVNAINLKLPQDNYQLTWHLESNGFVFSDIEEQNQTSQLKTVEPAKNQATITKVLTVAGNFNSTNKQSLQNSDGIGILKTEHLFLQASQPKEGRVNPTIKRLLSDAVTTNITQFRQQLGSRPIIYRPHILSSFDQPNPFIGFRGALRLIHQPEIFQLELRLLLDLVNQSPQPIGLLLPWVRTPTELKLLTKKIEEIGLLEKNNFNLWMEIATPAPLHEIEHYDLHALTGLVINIPALHSLTFGIDPSEREFLNQFQLSTTPITAQLKELHQKLMTLSQQKYFSNPLKLTLYLEDINLDLLEFAVTHNIEGVVVQQNSVHHTRQLISSLELSSLE